MSYKLSNIKEVLSVEDELLRQRRERLFDDAAAKNLDEDRFGIALSGGGIRSASINLGFLKTLNRFRILEKADYLSTVSGGGYTGSYIQSTLKNEQSYDRLFQEEHIDYLRNNGDYLVPGSGFKKLFNRITLIISFLVSLLMSWSSFIIIGLIIYGTLKCSGELTPLNISEYNKDKMPIYQYGIPIFIAIFVLHFVTNIVYKYNLDVSKWFNWIETAFIGIALLFFAGIFLSSFEFNNVDWENLLRYLFWGVALILLGFFTNPNALSFHRYYRKQLADAFLHFTGDYRNVLLQELFKTDSDRLGDYMAPYPLINTCLNLQANNDPNFKGSKTSDYFLLSPLFCGSKLTKYINTEAVPDYQNMTLPAAVTISAAAVNPGMGIYSNKLLSVMTTVFGARLGVWTRNPIRVNNPFSFVWWPFYTLYELFSLIGTDNNMVNISDGGHIENLGVYELLRRKCRLIIAVDAGADPEFTFSDLENLVVRSRNELGFDVRFREGQTPEDVIRPRPSKGYSKQRYAVADIFQLWEDMGEDSEGNKIIEHYDNKKVGTLVYVKSSVVAPKGKPVLSPKDGYKYDTYKYKMYHASFPHEPTADQFFDPIQWESYYQLGQYIAADILDIPSLEDYTENNKLAPSFGVMQLLEHFEESCDLFAAERKAMEGETNVIKPEMFNSPTEGEGFYKEPESQVVQYQM